MRYDEPNVYRLSEAPIIKQLDKEFKKLPKEEQQKIIDEVEEEMGLNNV